MLGELNQLGSIVDARHFHEQKVQGHNGDPKCARWQGLRPGAGLQPPPSEALLELPRANPRLKWANSPVETRP
jgi:hypothetical protein